MLSVGAGRLFSIMSDAVFAAAGLPAALQARTYALFIQEKNGVQPQSARRARSGLPHPGWRYALGGYAFTKKSMGAPIHIHRTLIFLNNCSCVAGLSSGHQ